MIKANINDFYSTFEQREKEGTILILDGVTAAEWAKFPLMCRDFFVHFESSLSLIPIPSDWDRMEVWLSVVEVGRIDLAEAEKFLTSWFFPEED